jgi:hypothetical protein
VVESARSSSSLLHLRRHQHRSSFFQKVHPPWISATTGNSVTKQSNMLRPGTTSPVRYADKKFKTPRYTSSRDATRQVLGVFNRYKPLQWAKMPRGRSRRYVNLGAAKNEGTGSLKFEINVSSFEDTPFLYAKRQRTHAD